MHVCVGIVSGTAASRVVAQVSPQRSSPPPPTLLLTIAAYDRWPRVEWRNRKDLKGKLLEATESTSRDPVRRGGISTAVSMPVAGDVALLRCPLCVPVFECTTWVLLACSSRSSTRSSTRTQVFTPRTHCLSVSVRLACSVNAQVPDGRDYFHGVQVVFGATASALEILSVTQMLVRRRRRRRRLPTR